jgi:PKHD-type hydroxylase
MIGDAWYYWRSTAYTSTVDQLVKDYMLKNGFLQAGSVGEYNTLNSEYRNSNIGWIYPNDSPQLFKDILQLGLEANRSNYGFDLADIPVIQLAEYRGSEEGHYDWHTDTDFLSKEAFERKLTIVMQLSDPEEYEGGYLELGGSALGSLEEADLKRKGSALAFPSYLSHRVTPVTKGVRRTLTAWVEGPKFR